ncbi:MAG: Fic family protein [Bacteroidota bacterium]
MENNLPIHLQEVVFGSSDPNISKKISKLEKEGKLRKIAPRLYTGNLEESPEIIVRRNIFTILGKLFSGAVLSHRSALEFKPTSTNQIFLTYTYTKKTKLPGLTIRFLKGHGPIEGDNLLSGDVYASQRARAFLENLQTSRKSGPDSKTLTYPEIEERLDQIVRISGDKELNKLRDKARNISEELGMVKEFKKLDKIISALLTTHSSRILTSPLAIARAFGVPYDPNRYELFEKLFRELKQFEFKSFKEKNTDLNSFRYFAFYEGYFSNYIEGTIFEIDEAKEIIETQTPLPTRNQDSHDILGTYKLVSNRKEMSVIPKSAEELILILQYRHKTLLAARKDKNPGEFKSRNNFAGQTSFVDLNLVKGTLIKGFEFYSALNNPFARAVYIMFMISEVHPFLDGNGRIARVMMNAELVSAKQSKIIIPNVYREDYILTLRRLTRQHDPEPYIRMLSRAHEFSSMIYGESMDEIQTKLEQSNAFLLPEEGKLKIITTDNKA